MTIVADLHIHTTASDGLLSAQDVLQLAHGKKLQAVAITDHDTVRAIPAAKKAGLEYGIDVITGIEFSTEYQHHEIHILGYHFDYLAKCLTDLFEKLKNSRKKRAEIMADRLAELGYAITLEEIFLQAKDAAPNRPHIARLLVEKGYFSSVPEVFAELLDTGKPAFVERYKVTPQEAIDVIHFAGGIASWAHPGLVENDNLLRDFMDMGLDGLEVYHPEHPPEKQFSYQKLAQEYKLLVTGGSDYHGPEIGRTRSIGSYGLNTHDYEYFEYYCKCRKSAKN